jgi:ribosomal protein S18 acetylase RimI-like enzyme
MRIEVATIEDASAILAIQKLAYQSEAEIYNDYSIPPLTQTMGNLIDEFKTHTIYKALQGNELVGSVRTQVKGNSCYVGRLIVHPMVQNQGIGSLLMAYIENHSGIAHRFELYTGHRSERNLSLYGKLGYREFKREKINDSLFFVFMEKRIDAI